MRRGGAIARSRGGGLRAGGSVSRARADREALAVLRVLERDTRWLIRARLRTAELLLEQKDVTGATRIVQSIAPTAVAEKKERRFLRGRVEAPRNRDNAIELYESILKNPSGATHSVLIATLFAIAEAHLQSHTPEAGDNYLEDFIEGHPADVDLPRLFAKLDQLYAAERKPSRHELTRWANDPAQPRRGLAQWYLARSYVRSDRRDAAREVFAQLRATKPARPMLAEAFLESAQLETRESRFAEAIEILDQARQLRPPAEMARRIEMALGNEAFRAARVDLAAETFQKLASPLPRWRKTRSSTPRSPGSRPASRKKPPLPRRN